MSLFTKFMVAVALLIATTATSYAATTYTYTSGSKSFIDQGSNFANTISFSFTVADGATGTFTSSSLLDYSFTNGSTTYTKNDSISSSDLAIITLDSTGNVSYLSLSTVVLTSLSSNYTSSLSAYYDGISSSSTAGFISSGLVSVQNYSAGTFTSSVSAVPEANSYAMMIAGLGLIGMVKRRKTIKSNTVQ